MERLLLRIEAEEIAHPDGPVQVFFVPSHPIGMPVGYKGAYWMRRSQSLVAMTPDMLKRIFNEGVPDFSAEPCLRARMADLSPSAIGRFRAMWSRKSDNHSLEHLADERLLGDAELLIDGVPTYAALVLFGTREALGRHLAQAEIIYEYRASDASVQYNQRKEYRQGFFLLDEDLWNSVNARNDVQHYQEGLFVWDIPTFSETVVREAILNAISHRDYRLPGSVSVLQFPRKLAIVSPGGFPPGITPENVLHKQSPRNRRIAEAFAKCGLVERSGQGFDRMFEDSIRHGKQVPDFAGTDDYQVAVTLWGEVQDTRFLTFLEKVAEEASASFVTEDLLVPDLVRREHHIPESLRPRLNGLTEHGVIEAVGRGKGVRHILSRRFYGYLGKKGVYTRRRGLDRQTNKELLLRHIQDYHNQGTRLQELLQVLPHLSYQQVRGLLQELKDEGRAHPVGHTRAALWYPGSAADSE